MHYIKYKVLLSTSQHCLLLILILKHQSKLIHGLAYTIFDRNREFAKVQCFENSYKKSKRHHPIVT